MAAVKALALRPSDSSTPQLSESLKSFLSREREAMLSLRALQRELQATVRAHLLCSGVSLARAQEWRGR
jgi:hypothetical protein